jgi:hypothetical protein
MTAPTDVTRVNPMSVPQILAQGAILPVWPTAAAALGGSPAGWSRGSTYAAARDGSLPVPCFKQGRRQQYVVRRCDLLAYLGLNDDATGGPAPVAPVEPVPVPTPAKK